MRDFIPYGRHFVDEDDIKAVSGVLRSEYLTGGQVVEQFEDSFASVVGAKYAVACSSGTAALHLASLAAGLSNSFQAVVPTITFLATANAPKYTGAEIIFSDVNRDTGLICAEELKRILDHSKGDIKAVFVVHLNGQSADIEAINNLCKNQGILVIEDACHALGGKYHSQKEGWQPTGSGKHSDMAVFSMHPVKNIAMGEGGMVVTNNRDFFNRLKLFRNHGMTRIPSDFTLREFGFDKEGESNPWYYEMQCLGYNYRASAIHCALGMSQLGKLDKFISHRRLIAAEYDAALKPLSEHISPIPSAPKSRHAWHLYAVHLSEKISRSKLMRGLQENGIGTQVHYHPVHLQPFYGQHSIKLENANKYYSTCLSLPIHMSMTKAKVQFIVGTIKNQLKTLL